MAQEQTTEEETEAEAETTEPGKVSLHIYMLSDAYERVKKFARYANIEGFIEGHARGNFTEYCNFCLNLGEQFLRQHMLKKRGYK